jgi:NADH dehydrogenase/NADH:ubiquinone oxidoreductase subunit G
MKNASSVQSKRGKKEPMPETITLTINGKKVTAPEGMTILEAATNEDIHIPTLCHHPALEPEGTCRLCIVEVSGSIRHSIRVSCIQEVKEGLLVETDTKRINNNRRLILELLLGRSPDAPYLRDLAAKYGVTASRFATGEKNDCILCGRCVRVCRDEIGAYALCYVNRGPKRKVTTDFEHLSEYCIGCGSCAQVCPTGAIQVEDRGDQRKIFTWEQVLARFKLERCDHCKTPFAPKKYLELINQKAYKPKGLELIDYICPECFKKEDRASERRKTAALRKSVVKWSVPR